MKPSSRSLPAGGIVGATCGAVAVTSTAGFASCGWIIPSPPGCSPGSPIHAMTVPARTVVPSGTRIFKMTPEVGLGISESTLSVFTSSKDSNSWMLSPSFFNHFITVPSTTDSPNCGMITCVAMLPPNTLPVHGWRWKFFPGLA